MELPPEGIFCVAKADNSEDVAQATAYFPYYFNLTKKQAEVAIKYIAVTPSWNLKTNLELTATNKTSGTAVTVAIDPLADRQEDKAVPIIRAKIEAIMGKEPVVRIVNARGNKTQVLKIKDKTEVTLSRDLAVLLGVKTHYDNTTGDEMVIPIIY